LAITLTAARSRKALGVAGDNFEAKRRSGLVLP